MTKGLVYLLQPAELVDTDRYKIGCSNLPNNSRLQNYKVGTIYYYVIKCDNASIIEDKLKKKFSEQFILFTGKEYFKGDIEEMKKCFISVIKGENIIYDEEMIETKKKNNSNGNNNNNMNENKSKSKCIMSNKYLCKYCDYSTDRASSYTKHNETQKHKKNCDAMYKYNCVDCDFNTNYISVYSRHLVTQKHIMNCQKVHNDDSKDIVIYQPQNANNQLTLIESNKDKQIINLQQQLLNEKDARIADKDNTVEILSSQLKMKDKQIKTSNGLLKYLMKNYPDAPPLQRINDMSFIKDDTKDRERMPELLIEYYNTDRFVPYLVENIIKLYKKDDPKDQSLWTSDASRDNFIIKNKINDNESKWMRDIKGSMVGENTIKPCLNLILDELNWYFDKIISGMQYTDRINATFISLSTMSKIRQSITDKKIEDEIRKKLSPEFCLRNTIENVK